MGGQVLETFQGRSLWADAAGICAGTSVTQTDAEEDKRWAW